MSNYAALGLLQGLGKGVANVGRDMSKNAIVAAQDNRAANREKLRREFAATENNRIYERNQGDQYSDNVDATTGARIRNKDTEGYEGETTSAAAWNQANKPASAFKEKVDYFDGKLKNKEITQDQYNNAMNLSRRSALTQKESVKMATDLRRDYAKAMDLLPPGEKPGFENWAKTERPEAWFMLRGNGGGAQPDQEPPPKPTKNPTDYQIDQLFAAMMKTDPSTWDAEIGSLHDKGYPEASKMLRDKVQGERRKLKKSEDNFQGNEEAKRRSVRFNNDPARNPKGLLEGGAASTLH